MSGVSASGKSGTVHDNEEALLHDTVAHAALAMATVEVKSTGPKWRPLTVTDEEPVRTKFPSRMDVIGAS
jgi:hypothetical protein